jgi:hypothetical protein
VNGSEWARVVVHDADADGVSTLSIDELRVLVHADVAASVLDALADLPSTVRVVALERARALIDQRLDAWEASVRTRLSGVH